MCGGGGFDLARPDGFDGELPFGIGASEATRESGDGRLCGSGGRGKNELGRSLAQCRVSVVESLADAATLLVSKMQPPDAAELRLVTLMSWYQGRYRLVPSFTIAAWCQRASGVGGKGEPVFVGGLRASRKLAQSW